MEVTRLLDEAVTSPDIWGATHPVTQEDLMHTMHGIKASIISQPCSQLFTLAYMNTVRGMVESFHPLTTKPTASANTQEKDIFI